MESSVHNQNKKEQQEIAFLSLGPLMNPEEAVLFKEEGGDRVAPVLESRRGQTVACGPNLSCYLFLNGWGGNQKKNTTL